MKSVTLSRFIFGGISGFAKRTASKIQTWAFSSAGHISTWGTRDPSTGIVITPQTASTLSAVNAAVRLLSDTFAMLPLFVYKRIKGGKQIEDSLELYRMLHISPNKYQTPFEFKELMMTSICYRGNGYAEKILNLSTGELELFPRNPDRMIPFWAPNGEKAYLYLPMDGKQRIIMQDEMVHIMFAPDMMDTSANYGLVGLDPIQVFRRSLGLTIGAEEFGARFYKNDATPRTVLEHPGKLTETAYNRLKKDWPESYAGVNNSNKTAVAEEGMKIRTLQTSPENSQFLETRKFQVVEIARWFRVPPHMIGSLEGATFSNIEMQSLEFLIYSLQPWLVKWEQALTKDLINTEENPDLFIKFQIAALLRGDTAARTAYYIAGKQWGWFSTNDIRRMEDMNDIDNGNIYLQPLNMIDVAHAEDRQIMPLLAALRANMTEDTFNKIIKNMDMENDNVGTG